MKELETRIFDIDVEEVRRKLKELKAVKVKEENQINNIYDFKDNFLLKQKGYARIRLVDDKLNNRKLVYMTTKKMLSQGTFKEMEENETIVEDKDAAERIFLSLGLELKQTIKKYRESYRLGDSLIEIDINDKSFCPFPYIEIETKSLESLEEIIKLLGYTLKDTSSKTIYEYLEERGVNKNNTAGI
ncbi:class IV adenylate cyclase [Caproiciproducens sp. MSJ-32]|uniref:class IV adenylate cyclase n=1 Tax=Caproiciproducens sp. MSJ-32 TaxID=2841527 RepID=UPI001C10C736|nr:CYTH domain-containing protein [Caproiciproducens sp. MSJ-32]MBU5454119.1 CYTH domain-containing protein [Caproiciproducens sp. MSJ-32]